jgi:hypothetical protein
VDRPNDPSNVGRVRPESRRADAARATSPPAVEATLASISDEVMNEAIARRARLAAVKPDK